MNVTSVGEIKKFCTNAVAEVADQCKGQDPGCLGEVLQVGKVLEYSYNV